jgi:hypothetical protein
MFHLRNQSFVTLYCVKYVGICLAWYMRLYVMNTVSEFQLVSPVIQKSMCTIRHFVVLHFNTQKTAQKAAYFFFTKFWNHTLNRISSVPNTGAWANATFLSRYERKSMKVERNSCHEVRKNFHNNVPVFSKVIKRDIRIVSQACLF